MVDLSLGSTTTSTTILTPSPKKLRFSGLSLVGLSFNYCHRLQLLIYDNIVLRNIFICSVSTVTEVSYIFYKGPCRFVISCPEEDATNRPGTLQRIKVGISIRDQGPDIALPEGRLPPSERVESEGAKGRLIP